MYLLIGGVRAARDVDIGPCNERDLAAAKTEVPLIEGMAHMLVKPTDSLLAFPHRSQWHTHSTTAFWRLCISAA